MVHGLPPLSFGFVRFASVIPPEAGAQPRSRVVCAPTLPFCCEGCTENVNGGSVIVVARHLAAPEAARRNATRAPEGGANNNEKGADDGVNFVYADG